MELQPAGAARSDVLLGPALEPVPDPLFWFSRTFSCQIGLTR